MRNLECTAEIVDGKLVPEKHITHFLRGKEGMKVRITISENLKKRSLNQNSYLYGVVEPHVRAFRAEQGDPVSDEEIHEDLLNEFAPRVLSTNIDGTVSMRPMRSSEMKSKEMCDYTTAITARMAQVGCHIPIPNEEMPLC